MPHERVRRMLPIIQSHIIHSLKREFLRVNPTFDEQHSRKQVARTITVLLRIRRLHFFRAAD